MVISAPVLCIRLLIMLVKGREILYWWYPSGSKEAHLIEKREIQRQMKQEHLRNIWNLCTTITSYKQKLHEKSEEMECWNKILWDKHMHPDKYDLSEFIPMPKGEYMLISMPKRKHQNQRRNNCSPLTQNNCWRKHRHGKSQNACNEARRFHHVTSPVVNLFTPTVNNRVKVRPCALSS